MCYMHQRNKLNAVLVEHVSMPSASQSRSWYKSSHRTLWTTQTAMCGFDISLPKQTHLFKSIQVVWQLLSRRRPGLPNQSSPLKFHHILINTKREMVGQIYLWTLESMNSSTTWWTCSGSFVSSRLFNEANEIKTTHTPGTVKNIALLGKEVWSL